MALTSVLSVWSQPVHRDVTLRFRSEHRPRWVQALVWVSVLLSGSC